MVEPLIGRGSGATRVVVTHDVEGGLAEADRALALTQPTARSRYEGPAGGPLGRATRARSTRERRR